MSEQHVIDKTPSPITLNQLVKDLRDLGVANGQTVLVHSSLSQIGWVSGGAQTVIMALIEVLGEEGTLMMPTHSAQNTDPANWKAPPVPQSWWQIIRDSRPAYDPTLTPTHGMGAIPELFRTLPDVKRGLHPIGSFSAIGKQTDFLLDGEISLEQMFGDESPIGRLYELDGYVLLLGVGHSNNTSLHLAEYRADFPLKPPIKEGTAMMVDGQRQWVAFNMQAIDDEDFSEIGRAYHKQHEVAQGKVRLADSIFLRQRSLVDFAVEWMGQHRT